MTLKSSFSTFHRVPQDAELFGWLKTLYPIWERLTPDSRVEQEPSILADTRRVVQSYHDAGRYAMLRIAVAPCSPFSVSQNLMRDSAALAREYGVGLHTHLAENTNDLA